MYFLFSNEIDLDSELVQCLLSVLHGFSWENEGQGIPDVGPEMGP
jgi:hypothetical protein